MRVTNSSMRFWHQDDVEPLATFIAEGQYDLWRLDRRGKSIAPANLDYLRSCFAEGLRQGAVGGFDDSHYLNVTRVRDSQMQNLKHDVAWVEARGGTDNFIVIGYHDGGIITISQEKLPFQQGAAGADWWGL